MKDQKTEKLQKTAREFSFDDFTEEELRQFDEDYAVCDIETSPPNTRKKKREEFEQEYKKPYPLER